MVAERAPGEAEQEQVVVKVTGRKPAPPSNVRPIRAKPNLSPTPKAKPVTPPSWLTLAQRKVFSRVVADLRQAGIDVQGIDSDLITAYVCAIDNHASAARLVATQGILVEGKDGHTVRNPAAIVVAQQARLVDALASSLGLTPASRQRMRVHQPPPSVLDTPAETPTDYFMGLA